MILFAELLHFSWHREFFFLIYVTGLKYVGII